MSREAKINELKLKDRIKELENEVASLKKRLDDLRKAKNTTILKREREVLEVGAPFGRREHQGGDGGTRSSELEKKLEEAEKNRASEVETMKKKFESEMDAVKKNFKDCGHEEELLFLRQRNEALENESVALLAENRELTGRVDALVLELSVKEAKWCETEEQLNLKLKTSFGEKYKEWIEATEAKIADLQKTNELLRTYLKNSRPDGKDPTQGK
ncbi:uncharacterized protein LOC143291594 isoform X2 [Babylonia areolata]